jgi:uncharacterized membrane protein
MSYLLLVFVHVASGVFWAGGAIVTGLFIIPSVIEAGPAGGAVMAGVVKRRLPIWFTAAGLLTALSGVWIYYTRFSAEWLSTPEGIVITAGALLAIAALLLGLFVQKPTVEQIGALARSIAAGGAPPTAPQKETMQALQQRLRTVAAITAWSLLGATLLMAVHRLAVAF